jgi:hypothetical protein
MLNAKPNRAGPLKKKATPKNPEVGQYKKTEAAQGMRQKPSIKI